MKAVVAQGVGGPEKLVFTDIPDPVPDRGEVVVRVGAAALNHADKWLLKGMLGPLPLVPGMDVAGTVVDSSQAGQSIASGTRVLLNPAITCGHCRYCNSGEHGLCAERRGLGQQVDGGFAEYVKIPATNILPLNDDLSFEEAAAIPSAFFTAWMLLTRRVKIGPGMTVLVMGAAGGVGSAATQIASLHGAHVIAAAGSARKLAHAQEWGADATVNYVDPLWARQVLELTGGEGVDVIVDAVGQDYWAGYADCIRKGGTILAFSMTTGQFGQVDIDMLIRRQISFVGSSPHGPKAVAREVMDMVNKGKLRGIVDRVWPLERAGEAEQAMYDRSIVGKIILTPG